MERKRKEQLEGWWGRGVGLGGKREMDTWGGRRTNFLEGKLCYKSKFSEELQSLYLFSLCIFRLDYVCLQ